MSITLASLLINYLSLTIYIMLITGFKVKNLLHQFFGKVFGIIILYLVFIVKTTKNVDLFFIIYSFIYLSLGLIISLAFLWDRNTNFFMELKKITIFDKKLISSIFCFSVYMDAYYLTEGLGSRLNYVFVITPFIILCLYWAVLFLTRKRGMLR